MNSLVKTVLVVLLVLLLIGSLPVWGWSSLGWGAPGGVGLLLLILVVLIIAEKV